MSTPPTDALVEAFSREDLGALAELYDRFAHPIDPLAKECEEAECAFNLMISNWHDRIPAPKPTFHDLRKAAILKCKRYIIANSKPPSI